MNELLNQAGRKLAAAENLFKQGSVFEDTGHTRAEEAVALYKAMLAGVTDGTMTPATRAEYRQHAYYNTACARALQGKSTEALNAFERALAAGFDIWLQITREPDFDSIRNEKRFKDLLVLAKAARNVHKTYFDQLKKREILFDFDFALKALDGTDIALEGLMGAVVIVTVFSTGEALWEAQAALWSGLKQAFDGRVEIVGLAWESTPEAINAEAGVLNYPVTLLSDKRLIGRIPDFGGLHTTLFIDKAGRVRFRSSGKPDMPAAWIVSRLLDMEDAGL